MGAQITDYLLYRWRYIIGHSVIALTVVGLIIVAGIFVPNGLSPNEMSSVVASDAISFSMTLLTPDMIINLPYHLLQRASMEAFGVTTFAIKLPSMVLALLSAVGVLILLRTWFRHNVAIITTILVITTGQFLFVAQSGTPSVVYVFWTTWLLVAAMMISRQARGLTWWKIMLFAIIGLSLYTPLSVYIIIALFSAVILHPHLRYIVRRLSKPKLLLAAVCALIFLAPLIYTIVRFPATGMTLLGIPDTMPNFKENIVQLLQQYFNFVSPTNSVLMTPIYGLGSMLLILLGVFRLVTTKYTARSYIITTWIVLLLPVLIVNPSYVSITFVPVILLMGMGITRLLYSWYRLFPRNPYARMAGLIPLAVVIGGMMFSGIDRYMYGYLYSPQTASNFSNDLQLVNSALATSDRNDTQLIASDREYAFYNVIARNAKDVTIINSNNVAPASPLTATTTILTREANATGLIAKDPYRILTASTFRDGDRFYIYKTTTE